MNDDQAVNAPASDPREGQRSSDNAHGCTRKRQPADLTDWTTRMCEGMVRMATDEAERLKVARRLF